MGGRSSYEAAVAECRAGRFTEVREDLRTLLDEPPTRIDADLELARLLQDAGQFGESAEFYCRVVEARPFDTEVQCSLADVLRAMGRHREAESLYRHAAECAPARPDVHLGLALVLHEQRRLSEAAESYRRVLALDPSLPLARFLLSSITGESTPTAAPPEVIEELFDGYAVRFDDHLQATLGYHAPKLIRELFDRLCPDRFPRLSRLLARQPVPQAVQTPALETDPSLLDILDLGCGTGLCGSLFRSVARRLVGVDLSSRMLGKARDRGGYDELRQADMLDTLGREQESYDLILAADVFVYIGDLAPVFAGCIRALRPGGMFLFTTESDDVAGYAVSPHGRFVHARDYVLGLAAEHGFTVLAGESFPLRREHGSIIAGDLFGLAV